MRHPKRVLIVKPGYSETLCEEVSPTPSMGDVFRTTVLLHRFRGHAVTWVTSAPCVPLFEGNSLVERVLVDEPAVLESLLDERFDKIVNLEKVPELCRWADRVEARERFGFRWDDATQAVVIQPRSRSACSLLADPESKRRNKRCWSELLYDMVGARWQGEACVLGYRARTEVEFDVGFNMHVGTKWPNKAWPFDNWKKLEGLLESRYTVSYQRGTSDLYTYMDWLHSCRLVVSNDSLGVHLALAMGKKLVVLFGPTPSCEIDLYGKGTVILPDRPLDCLPCLVGTCTHNGRTCLEYITPRTVGQAVDRLLWYDQHLEADEVAIA